jgi:hypothetical protein
MRPRKIAIVTIKDDLHALIIQKALRKYENVQCDIVESNHISGRAVLSWSNGLAGDFECQLPVGENAHD